MNTYREWILPAMREAMFGYELGVQAASQPQIDRLAPGDESMQSGSGANR